MRLETKTSPEVVEAMLPYFYRTLWNPSSIYSFAAANKGSVSKQERRSQVWSEQRKMRFILRREERKPTTGHWRRQQSVWRKRKAYYYDEDWTSCRLHANIFKSEVWGYLSRWIWSNPKSVEAAIRPDTIMISVMFGGEQRDRYGRVIKEIGAIAHEKGILFTRTPYRRFVRYRSMSMNVI